MIVQEYGNCTGWLLPGRSIFRNGNVQTINRALVLEADSRSFISNSRFMSVGTDHRFSRNKAFTVLYRIVP